MEQSRVAILNRNETVNEPCASDLMRIYNLDIAPTAHSLNSEGGSEVNLQRVRAAVIYK